MPGRLEAVVLVRAGARMRTAITPASRACSRTHWRGELLSVQRLPQSIEKKPAKQHQESHQGIAWLLARGAAEHDGPGGRDDQGIGPDAGQASRDHEARAPLRDPSARTEH